MSKDKRPSWFKMFRHQKPLFDSVSNETAGIVLKAAFEYFETGEIPQLEPLEFAMFSSIKQYIDESYEDFERISEQNRQNVLKRWKSQETSTED